MPLAETEEYLKQPTYPVVRLETPYVDARGAIQNLTTKGCQSVAVITSKSGTQRANHVHKTDEHLTVLVYGRLRYWWQEGRVEGDTFKPTGLVRSVEVNEGQAFHTPPHLAHCMQFLEDSVIVTVAPKARDSVSHEADLIRVPSLVQAREQ